jgi:hypothetical protein
VLDIRMPGRSGSSFSATCRGEQAGADHLHYSMPTSR